MQRGRGGACGHSLTCSQPALGAPTPPTPHPPPALRPSPGLHGLSSAPAAAQLQRQKWKTASGLRRAQAGLCAISDTLDRGQLHLRILRDGEPSPWLLQPHIKGLFPFFLGFPRHAFLSILQIFRGTKSWHLPFALIRAGGMSNSSYLCQGFTLTQLLPALSSAAK